MGKPAFQEMRQGEAIAQSTVDAGGGGVPVSERLLRLAQGSGPLDLNASVGGPFP